MGLCENVVKIPETGDYNHNLPCPQDFMAMGLQWHDEPAGDDGWSKIRVLLHHTFGIMFGANIHYLWRRGPHLNSVQEFSHLSRLMIGGFWLQMSLWIPIRISLEINCCPWKIRLPCDYFQAGPPLWKFNSLQTGRHGSFIDDFSFKSGDNIQ